MVDAQRTQTPSMRAIGKRAICIVLAIALCWTIPLYPRNEAFAETQYTDSAGNIWYYTVSNGEATIERCSLSRTADDVVVPAAIDGVPVTAVAGDSGDLFYGAYVNSITFPASIESITEEGFGMFFDTAIDVDGEGVFFLGACPSDIDWLTLCMMDPYTQFFALSEYVDAWEASFSDAGLYDSSWSAFEAPLSVEIRQDDTSVDRLEMVPGATRTLAAASLPESSAYRSFHEAASWESDNPLVSVTAHTGVVSVDASAAAGATATVTATNALGMSDTVEIAVVAPTSGKVDIATGCSFAPDSLGEVYLNGGAPSLPDIVITNNETQAALVEGVDYEISFETAEGAPIGSLPTEAGSYQLVITGAGQSYEGVFKMPFTLVDALSAGGWQYRPSADGTWASLCGYDGDAVETLVAPAYIAGLEVHAVESDALASATASTIVVPDTVKTIGAGAFASKDTKCVRFLGSSPTFEDPSSTFGASAKVEVFADLAAGYTSALKGAAAVEATDQVWSYYLSIAADGTETGTLGATGSLYAFHGQSDPLLDLELPESIDGVALSVLGDYCLYGDFEELRFAVVRVPETYTHIADFALLDLVSLVVFEGACPEKVGDFSAGITKEETELWYPASEQLSWEACSWADPSGSYDDAWRVTMEDGSPVIVGYQGSASVIEVPSMFYGREVSRMRDVAGDAAGATSIVVARTIDRIEGTLFENASCDIVFQSAPPEITDAANLLKGPKGASYAGTVWYPASFESEWAQSDIAKYYTTAAKIACNPEDYLYEQTDAGVVIVGYVGTEPDIEIPSEVNIDVDGVHYEGAVVGIGESAFSQKGITGVVIPGSVESIGREAFWHCNSLRMVKMSEGVESIGMNAFWYCPSLVRIDLPASLSHLDDHPFVSSSLQEINVAQGGATFSSVDGVLFNADKTVLVCYPMGRTQQVYRVPDTVKTIGAGAFRGEYSDTDNALSEVVLPDGLTKIEWAAFRNAEGLTTVSIPDSVVEMGTYVFDSCGKLSSVTFPAGLTEIPEGVLAFDSAVTSIEIPEGVRRIGDNAFQLTSITTLELPEGLTEIGKEAFDGCGKLETISLPSTLLSVEDNAFTSCDSVTSLDLTKTAIQSIGNGAFAGMESLESVVVPNTVTSFGRAVFMQNYRMTQAAFEEPCQLSELPSQTFAWCPLRSFVVPATMTSVGEMAFYQCTDLSSIVFLQKGTWTLGPNAFLYAADDVKVYGYTSSSTKANMDPYEFCPIDVTVIADVPELTEVRAGETVSLRVAAVTQHGTLVYQWYQDGVAIEGATGETYEFSAKTEGASTYSVTVSNSYDPYTSTVSTGVVRVSSALIDVAEGVIISAIPDQPYSARPVEPALVVRAKDGTLLAAGSDYRVEYCDNVEPGQAKAIVTGVGEYCGQVEVPFAIVAPQANFTDVDLNAWYAGYVNEAARLGIIKGRDDAAGSPTGLFDPEGMVTRGEIAVMLARAAGADTSSLDASALPFDDVDPQAFYAAALAWAYEQGIVTGDTAVDRPTVRPDDPVTRQEIAVIMARYAKVHGVSVEGSSTQAFFSAQDWRAVEAWAVPSFVWTADAGVVSGKQIDEDTLLLDPAAYASRAEVAKMVVVMTTEIIR